MASSSFLQRLYSIPSSMRSLRHVNNSIAIVEFTEQYFNHKDLDTYLDAMANNDVPQQLDTAGADAPSTGAATPGVAAASTNAAPAIRRTRSPPKVVGFNNDTEALLTGDEARLDLQVVGGLLGGDPLGDADWPTVADLVESHDAPSSLDVLSRIWMWNVAGRESPNPEEPFLRWLLAVQELRAPPLVHSVSYGDLEEQLPLFYMQRINVEFLKLGLRGVTLVFPSGDKGVASDFEPEEEACKRSRPEFPVSSPVRKIHKRRQEIDGKRTDLIHTSTFKRRMLLCLSVSVRVSTCCPLAPLSCLPAPLRAHCVLASMPTRPCVHLSLRAPSRVCAQPIRAARSRLAAASPTSGPRRPSSDLMCMRICTITDTCCPLRQISSITVQRQTAHVSACVRGARRTNSLSRCLAG